MTIRQTILLGSLLTGIGLVECAVAQEAVVRRGSAAPKIRTQADVATQSDSLGLSLRALEHNRRLTQDLDRVAWKRTIYRYLSLSDERNAALYYPVVASEAVQNLFVRLFRLVATDQVIAYEYLDGQELFDQAHQIKFKDLLDRFRISYSQGKGQENERYQVALPDIPSAEVRGYYVKEAWYFDQTNSTYDVQVEAICPILYDTGDYGEVPMPLFWLPYASIRPYLQAVPVMLSSHNNVASATIDDFFGLQMYHGEIVKTQNLLGKSLAQYADSPDSLKLHRQRIEAELKTFEHSLFVPDSVINPRHRPSSQATTPMRNSRDKRIRSAKANTPTKANKVKPAKSAQKPQQQARPSGRSVRGRH